MVNSGLKTIINYPIVGEIFPSIGVAVNIFQIEEGYNGKTVIADIQKGQTVSEFECDLKGLHIIPIGQMDYNIIHKVTKDMKESFSKEVYPQECFRIASNMTIGRGENKYEIDASEIETDYFDVAIAYINGTMIDFRFIHKEDIPARAELIDTYKIISGARLNKSQNVITNLNTLGMKSVCSSSYNLLYASKNKADTYGAYTYIRTRFFRFLVRLLCDDGMTNMSPYRFSLVPIQDFTKTWSDEELYQKYNLTQEEIDYIESTIKPMN